MYLVGVVEAEFEGTNTDRAEDSHYHPREAQSSH